MNIVCTFFVYATKVEAVDDSLQQKRKNKLVIEDSVKKKTTPMSNIRLYIQQCEHSVLESKVTLYHGDTCTSRECALKIIHCLKLLKYLNY